MKMKEFGSRGGGRVPGAPLDPPPLPATTVVDGKHWNGRHFAVDSLSGFTRFRSAGHLCPVIYLRYKLDSSFSVLK